MNKNFLATTENGFNVYVGEETMKHMEAHSDVPFKLIAEAIGKISDYNGQFRIGAVDMGRMVGKDCCVTRTPENEELVQMLCRKGREGLTPVILEEKGGVLAETNFMVVGICKDEDDKATLFTSFFGQLAPKEPYDPRLKPEEKEESEEFWATHALVISDSAIDWEKTKELVSG